MKKVLFATTALVATAGVAAADVTFGGYGRFGIVHITDDGTGDSATNVTSRFRLQIDATAESDAGVTFGARVRIQQNEGQQGMTNGARFFARSGGLEVGVGNIFGALESFRGMYPIDLGLTGHNYDYTAYNFRGDAYSSGGLGNSGDNGVEVMYSAGDLSVHVSASDTDDRIAATVAYKAGGFDFGLGAQDSDNAADTELAAYVSGSFGPVDMTLAYADNGTAGDHIVLTGRFDVGAATNIEAYIADADQWSETGFGIDFNHSLGGGTSLRGGVSTGGSVGDETLVDLGVRFDF
ncbi:Outer membrane porin [Sulfitobacter noctilucicola]|uniref:Outer membrane protein OmpU n=1 Tax=Sulfitobacter noctilucicola TaxID=1342301 RepID=A0A7W6Q455_9RHOB|nr:porin [Sulfitobacter noctilucicola]KIN63128.1 Outer membrane porin [Sulfitobacter noctilucicola]MBB4172345.1 outer membrane protein OmpU [Sulfitobacter noctilucicola]